ncbi:hypothetical protein AB0E63_03680 [Kribbella sp. NPDC026596]|uniref:hypothetical protein n=1 Tax=Kribbella sp. NPDC026596 TaxID=3155122 RepID=UPI0033E579A6
MTEGFGFRAIAETLNTEWIACPSAHSSKIVRSREPAHPAIVSIRWMFALETAAIGMKSWARVRKAPKVAANGMYPRTCAVWRARHSGLVRARANRAHDCSAAPDFATHKAGIPSIVRPGAAPMASSQ